MSSLLKYNYIPVEKEKNLKDYKYSAEDHSLLYNYFFSPIAGWSVNFTPEWIAPNLLTLGGLIFIVMPYLVLACYSPWELEVDVPKNVYLFICLSHFIYFHLDNMDGKQARKTGNSSALGLIFDHGCDAISVYMQATTIISLLQVTGIWQIIILFTPTITFFLTNLEELYTHKMYLPIINPAIEGVVITGVLIGLGGIYGQEYINTTQINYPLIGEVTISQSIVWFVVIGAIVSTPGIFYRIYKSVGTSKLLEAFTKTWYMFYAHGVILYFNLYSDIAPFAFRYAIMLLAFCMSKQLTLMLLSSASKSKFTAYAPTNFVILTAFLINTILAVNQQPHFDEFKFLIACVVLTFFIYCHLIKNVADQMCRVLKIKCFKVKDKKIE